MEEVMQSNSFFMLPLTLAYGSICLSWFVILSKRKAWNIESIDTPKTPWIDLGLSLMVVLAIFAIGQLYSAGFLLPRFESETINGFIWILNNCLIFSPIFLVLFFRKQSLKTLFISSKNFFLKISFGMGAAFLGTVVFVSLRSEWSRMPEIILKTVQFESIINFPAVFFENIALAFLFVRLKWVLGLKSAIIIPSILFALAHVPGSIAEGDAWSHIIAFFFLTGSLTTFILYTAYRSRDIIWLGVVHYVMDIVIKAI